MIISATYLSISKFAFFKTFNGWYVFSLAVKTPVSHSRVPGFKLCFRLLIPASCSCRSWETAMMAQIKWFLQPSWGTRIEFLAYCFHPAPGLRSSEESVTGCQLPLCLYLRVSLCLSATAINFRKLNREKNKRTNIRKKLSVCCSFSIQSNDQLVSFI